MKAKQITLEQPPQEITQFAEWMAANKKRCVPGSLIWLRHPEKAGQWVGAVIVKDEKREDGSHKKD